MTGWLRPADADPDATARLVLLHHAGGTAAAYGPWLRLLPSDIGAQCVQLPGRHERRHEPPYTEIEPLADALAAVLTAELDDRPFALFGHSMGALLAYRLVDRLAAAGHRPALVGLSGWAPSGAGAASPEPPAVALPDGLAGDPGLLAAAREGLAADLAACAGFHDDGRAVACPAVAYAGRADPLAGPAAMAGWAARCPHYLGLRVFPGDHFFLHRHAAAITADLVQLIRRVL